MILRKLAERLSRGVVLKRKLPADFQKIPVYVTPEAGLRYLGPMSLADPMLYRMARELVKTGACVWDVGANVGLFSFAAAALSGKAGFVLAIEPDIWLASLLNRSSIAVAKTGRYRAAPIAVLCAAVSDDTSIRDLAVAERSRAASHLRCSPGSSQAEGTRYLQPTISVLLDSLLTYFPAPDLLKIDVETHELQVLQGARRILGTIRPNIWCEVSPENADSVFNLLNPLGYELFAATADVRMPLKRASWNTLAIAKSD